MRQLKITKKIDENKILSLETEEMWWQFQLEESGRELPDDVLKCIYSIALQYSHCKIPFSELLEKGKQGWIKAREILPISKQKKFEVWIIRSTIVHRINKITYGK